MPTTTWALEIWTHPRLGTPTFVAALPHAGAQLYDRPDAVVDSFVQIPATRRDIIFEALKFDPITRASSRSRIIRAFRVDGGVRQTLPDHEFVAADLTYQLIGDGQQVARIAGPDLRGSADDATILPWDYPAQPSTARDWLWDGPNIFDNGYLENISNERQSFWFDPLPGPTDTFQISFDGEITAAITWGSDANQRRADVKAAMENLTNTSLVEVTGAGGVGSKLEITWRGIRAGENLPQLTIINNTGGTPFSETEATGGFADIGGWTNIYNPITGATSGSQTIRSSSPDLGETGLNGSKACIIVPFQAGEQFSGGQVIVGVTPGQRYQLSILVDVSLTGNYRFVVRDMIGETESELKKTEVNLTAATETTVTIADLDIPSDVNRVTVRFAIIDNPASAGQIKMDELQIREGLQSANAGGIALALLNDLQTAHTPRTRLTWLTPDFDATNDSSATPWAISALPFAARDGQRFATHVLEGLRELGFSWDVVPDTLTSYQLKLWDLGNRGTDHTADDSIAFLIGQLAGGKFQMRLPEATNVRAVGADGAWSETEDADLVTAFGNIDGFIESEDWLDTAATTRAAQERLNAGIANALSLAATTTDSSGPVPWRDVSPGDTANWTLSDALVAKHPRTIAQVIVKIDGAGRWSCDWTGSRVFGGKSSQLEGLRALLTEFRRRLARGAKATPTVPSTASPTVYGGTTIPWLVAASSSPQAWKDIAGAVCDATNDEVEIQAALDTYGRCWLAPGTFRVIATATGAIHVTGSDRLVGSGKYTTVITEDSQSQPAAGASCIRVTGSEAMIEDLYVENNGWWGQYAIHLDGCSNVRVNRVYAECWRGGNGVGDAAAIRIESAPEIWITDCELVGSASGTEADPNSAIWVTGNSSQLFIERNQFFGGTYSIYVDGGSGGSGGFFTTIAHNLFWSTGWTHLLFDWAAGFEQGGSGTITGNYFQGWGGNAIDSEKPSAIKFLGDSATKNLSPVVNADSIPLTIHDNYIAGGGGGDWGVLIDGRSGAMVQGNVISRCGPGVQILNADEAQILSNTFAFCGGASPGNDYSAIEVGTNSDRARLQGNRIFNSQGDTLTHPDYGIRIETADCNDTLILANDLRTPGEPFVVAPILNNGTGTVFDWPADPTYGDNFT